MILVTVHGPVGSICFYLVCALLRNGSDGLIWCYDLLLFVPGLRLCLLHDALKGGRAVLQIVRQRAPRILIVTGPIV